MMVDPADATRRKCFEPGDAFEELLVPIFRGGELVYDAPPLVDVRTRAVGALAQLDPSITRFLNPHGYPVGLEKSVNDLRTDLVLRARGLAENSEE
jgi:nicotinate phosphoribosyltransferase